MPIKQLQGGVWKDVGGDGKIRVKVGAAWVAPSSLRYKWNGVWNDPGYKGYPAVPNTPTVSSWTYSGVVISWTGGTGGAPVASWEAQQLNEGGTVISGPHAYTTPPSGTFGVAPDTRYQFQVRAKSAAGLYSAWSGVVRTQIGHDSSPIYGFVTRQKSRAWSQLFQGNVNMWRDNGWGITVPGNVFLQRIDFALSVTSATSLLSGTGTRWVSEIWNSVDQGDAPSLPNPWNASRNYANWSNNTVWGLIPHGTGWSSVSNGPWRVVGTMNGYGTEYYDETTYEQTGTNPAVANSYW
jgi:hypothetical protein